MLDDKLGSIKFALKELADINTALDEALIVAITDPKGIIKFANDKFCQISKYAREELIGHNHRIINSGYHSKEFFKEMWKTIGNGGIWRGEIRNKAKDGTYYWMDTTIVPCLNEAGKPYQYVSFRIDITDRKKAEDYLRMQEKVAIVGQMASGIAHEIRNPLAAIKWSIKLMQSNYEDNKHHMDLILSEIDRVDSIVGELLSLGKPYKSQNLHFEETNFKSLLETTVSLMNIHAMRNHSRIVSEVDSELPFIYCDPNQLKQVFINLLKNAVEAMPEGGEIRINANKLENDTICIEVIDEGIGIPPEVQVHLGVPFYTTKEKGTGLGLMICQKIIQDHQGHLTMDSKVNKGTKVTITLPVSIENRIITPPSA